MGTDIHMYVEYKVDKGKWKPHPDHSNNLNIDSIIHSVNVVNRNYDFFGLLAGVRCDNEVYAKGLPKNMSEEIKDAYNQWSCVHNQSYMTLNQFSNTIKKHNAIQKKTENYYLIPDTEETDMFYEWSIKKSDPPAYSTIVSACNAHAAELQIDNILLGVEPSKVKHRIIFWFDS